MWSELKKGWDGDVIRSWVTVLFKAMTVFHIEWPWAPCINISGTPRGMLPHTRCQEILTTNHSVQRWQKFKSWCLEIKIIAESQQSQPISSSSLECCHCCHPHALTPSQPSQAAQQIGPPKALCSHQPLAPNIPWAPPPAWGLSPTPQYGIQVHPPSSHKLLHLGIYLQWTLWIIQTHS